MRLAGISTARHVSVLRRLAITKTAEEPLSGAVFQVLGGARVTPQEASTLPPAHDEITYTIVGAAHAGKCERYFIADPKLYISSEPAYSDCDLGAKQRTVHI